MRLASLPRTSCRPRHRPAARRRRQAALGAGTALVAGGLATLGGQVLWTARRRLPALEGLDASGVVPGSGHPHAGPPIRLVALGDSTLTGPGLADPDDVWLRRSLLDLRLERTVEVTSLAVGGSRAADVHRIVPAALELRPDMVVVAVGSNDAFHGTNIRSFAEALDAIVAMLLTEIPTVVVCNVGDLGNVARVPMPLSSVLRQRSLAVSRRIEAVVARHEGATLLDVSASNVAFRDRGVFAEDLFHPNRSGHQIWADVARPGLSDALTRLAGAPHPPA